MWIGDVFGRDRGEQIDLDDIHLVFHRIPEMDTLEMPDNHIILGAKGCGKSTALRALTLRAWRQRAPHAIPSFVGVYQQVQSDEISPFNATCEAGTTGLFEHYFAVTYLLNAATQLADVLPEGFPLLEILSRFFRQPPPSMAAAAQQLLDERFDLQKHVCRDPLATAESFVGKLDLLSVKSIYEFAGRFSVAAMPFRSDVPNKLGLLLDSFDYYGTLCGVLGPFFEGDANFGMVTKVAARRLNVREFVEGSNRRLEDRRDYRLISLDRDTDTAEHTAFVREALCKRVRRFLRDLPAGVRDEDIFGALFSGATDEGSDITSFENICRVSSGNVLAVFSLLDKAAEIQRTSCETALTGLAPLSREHRLAAIRQQSKHFWEHELAIRVPRQKSEADAFCATALAMARGQAPHNLLSPRFTLEIVPDKSLVATMLSSRVLVALDRNVNLEVQAGFEPPSPLNFELNRLLLSKVDRLPKPGAEVRLDRQQFAAHYKKALEERKPYMAPRGSISQRELFGDDFCVFISMPFANSRRQTRTNVVRSSLKRFYKEAVGQAGGPGFSHIDIKWIPRTGSFRQEIPDVIRECRYMLADVSDLGESSGPVPGVFYEIGLAIGERKPLALFYNRRDGSGRVAPFNVEMLPIILRGQTVLVWERGSGNFHDIFRPVHQLCLSYNGIVNSEGGSSRSAAPKRYAYLSFQPIHDSARRWFSEVVRALFPELSIVFPREWSQDEIWEARRLIADAELCVIDCTKGANDFALELGIATATGRRRVLQTWNTVSDRSLEPVSMYPGRRWGWTDLGEADRKYLCGILEQIGGQSSLGSRRI